MRIECDSWACIAQLWLYCVGVNQVVAAGWEARMTETVARQIDHWRGVRSLGAQKLADRTAELGMPVARNTIANLENGRRTTRTVGELLALAAALDIPPVVLLVPLGTSSDAETLPGVTVSTDRAFGWVAASQSAATASFAIKVAIGGTPRVVELIPELLPPTDAQLQGLLALFRQHGAALQDALTRLAAQLAKGYD